MRFALLAGAVLLLSACSQENAPSDEVKKAADDVVDAAQGASPTPQVAVGPYAPRDECQDLEGGDDFRQKIAQAVEGRDLDGFVALAAKDIKLDFGGGSGANELRTRLAAEDGKLWKELDKLLAMGCATNSQGGMTIPWYSAQELPGDPGMSMIVTGEDIPLIDPADGKAESRISWDLVTLADGFKPDAPFQLVTFKSEDAEVDGPLKGYVASPVLRSPLAYRLSASRRNGKWSIISLVAGD